MIKPIFQSPNKENVKDNYYVLVNDRGVSSLRKIVRIEDQGVIIKNPKGEEELHYYENLVIIRRYGTPLIGKNIIQRDGLVEKIQ